MVSAVMGLFLAAKRVKKTRVVSATRNVVNNTKGVVFKVVEKGKFSAKRIGITAI